MRLVKEFLIIIFFLFLGSLLASLFDFPIPTTVYGMVLLFLALNFKLVRVEDVEGTGNQLIGLLSLFLVPSSVSFMETYSVIRDDVAKIVVIVVLSTLITMVVTAKTVEVLGRRVNG